MHIDGSIKCRKVLAEHFNTQHLFGQGCSGRLHKVSEQGKFRSRQFQQLSLAVGFLFSWVDLNVLTLDDIAVFRREAVLRTAQIARMRASNSRSLKVWQIIIRSEL